MGLLADGSIKESAKRTYLAISTDIMSPRSTYTLSSILNHIIPCTVSFYTTNSYALMLGKYLIPGKTVASVSQVIDLQTCKKRTLQTGLPAISKGMLVGQKRTDIHTHVVRYKIIATFSTNIVS